LGAEGTYEGVEGILVPARKIWRIQNVSGTAVEKTTNVDDGVNTLSDDQCDRKYQELVEQAKHPKVLGQTFEEFFPSSRTSSTRASSARSSRDAGSDTSEEVDADKRSVTRVAPRVAREAPRNTDVTPKKSLPFGSSFTLSPLHADAPQSTRKKADIVAARAERQQKRTGHAKPANTVKPPRPGKVVNASVLGARLAQTAPAKAAAKSRGRPMHDCLMVAEAQIAEWNASTDTDETFFGTGYKNHKAFLTRTKTALELKMQSSTERSGLN
jgi:hypothetical protein